MKIFSVIVLTIVLLSCNKATHKNSQATLNNLVDLMSGSFSSIKQSQEDKEYYDIRLQMQPIWTNSTDGRWLYVEQAVSTHLDKPYRQRVYHVTSLNNGQFASAVYELPQSENFIGAHDNTSIFDTLKPKDLIARKGCTVFLKQVAPHQFSGSTDTDKCLSSLRGASYATSIVNIEKDKISSWDRGFDDKDQHVWGAEKGAYVFDRQ